MRRLALVPVLVLIVLLSILGAYYIAVRSRTPEVPVVIDKTGAPPVIADGSVPTGAAPAPAPLPDMPPEGTTPQADQPTLDADPPALALPADVRDLPAPAAAAELLKKMPAEPSQADSKSSLLSMASPIDRLHPRDIRDTFTQGRPGGRTHEAADIMAPQNTPVKAVVDGTITKMFLSKPGGITIYEFDPTSTYSYYYAHLDHYAPGLKEGMKVKRGDVIGFVGTTGDANKNSPHLHFAMFQLLPGKKWWQGTPINPYPHLLRSLTTP